MSIIESIEQSESAFASPEQWPELETPCSLVDAGVVARNISRMAIYCRTRGLALRPHTKTHKSQQIAQMQLNAGAVGLTVAKPGEAQVMTALGAEMLIAYPSVTHASLLAIQQGLAQHDMIVALDSLQAVDRLESALSDGDVPVGVLVDVDVGLHRTGLQSPDESLILASRIASCDKLRLDGLFCYPGHIWSPPEEQTFELQQVDSVLCSHLERWRAEGLAARIVSGGSTPTAYQTHHATSFTEIRPGTYVFNDMNTALGGFCTLNDCAVRILATVVSTAVPGQVVIDAGAKTLAADRCISAPDSGQGYVVEYPDARIAHLSEEHGQIDVSRCSKRPRVGERITVIPNHVCPTINLTDFVWWLTPSGPQRLSIDARGRVR